MNHSTRKCCVPDCKNSESKNPELHFYSFPGKKWEFERKRKWIRVVNRLEKDGKPWTPSKNSRICSIHFVGGKKSNNPNNPAFLPSIFSDKDKRVSETRMKRFERARNRSNQVNSPALHNFDNFTINVDIESSTREIGIQTDPSETLQTEEPNILFCYSTDTEVSIQTNIIIKKAEKARLILPNVEIKPKMKCTASGPDLAIRDGFTGFADIKTDLVLKQLGGVSLALFSVLLEFITPGNCGQPRYLKKIGREDRLLLFLMKMKLGISFCALGCIFGIHSTTVSRIFFEVLQTLATFTKTWIFWPSKAAIKATLPVAFHNYPNCRAIIDCTELKCDTPPTVEQRILMYSRYKSGFTVKFLIGIAPNGLITFLSKGYGGRATDSFITNDSGFLNLIESGDLIMADKGFPQITTELLGRNATFVMPPFAHNPQFTEEEVNEGYQIASVRIHVERAIQRIKIFNILRNINIELLPYIDHIMHICCILANDQPPLIKADE